jgi:hypothetical protein
MIDIRKEETNRPSSNENIEKKENKLLKTLSIVADNLETYQGRDTLLTLLVI